MTNTGLRRGAVAFAVIVAWANGSSAAQAAGCPNDGLRGLVEQALPDCRAYEQVSPLDKNGSDVGNHGADFPAFVASTDGTRLAFDTLGALPGAQSAAAINPNLSRRAADGWSTQPIAPPIITLPSFDVPSIQFYTDDLRHVFLRTPPGPWLADGQMPGAANLLVRDNDDGGYRTISVLPPSGAVPPEEIRYVFAGASADLRHIVFEADDPLTPDAPLNPSPTDRNRNLYELVDGQVRLVTILPDGTPAPHGGGAGGYDGATQQTQSTVHAVSADGARIVFGTSAADPDGGQIYVREDGQHTVMATASHRTVPDANPGRSTFWGASADGSQVFFTSEIALTDDAELGSQNLYRFDVDDGTLTNLAPDPDPASPDPLIVQGVLGTSDDGSYVYFRGTKQHVPGQGVDGSSNIYLWHDGAIRFIATDPAFDPSFDFHANKETFRVTPDGRALVFMTTTPLTGYDNTDAATGSPDSEVYLYEADAQALTCVSCRSDGSRPTGSSTIPRPPDNASRNLQRTVSADGRRVFFDSRDALTPADVNGKADVYEWEDGAVHLISTGHSRDDSFFAAASADGDDVFLATREQLVARDTDEHLDVYDARVGGGFPEPVPAVPCSGDGCQGRPTPSPPRPAPESVSATGGGNAPRGAKKVATFRVGTVSAAARRSAASHGTITLSVRVSEGGIVRARATRGTVNVASATAYPPRAGTVHLKLRLSKGTRADLARGRRVRLRVRVSFSHVHAVKTTSMGLAR
jgi:hypothetical protein